MDKKSNSRQFFKQHVEKQKIINYFAACRQPCTSTSTYIVHSKDFEVCYTLPVPYVLVFAVCKAVGTIWYTFVIAND